MSEYSSEAIKKGIILDKDINKLTSKELKEFESKIDPDSMGFDGTEGMVMEDA